LIVKFTDAPSLHVSSEALTRPNELTLSAITSAQGNTILPFKTSHITLHLSLSPPLSPNPDVKFYDAALALACCTAVNHAYDRKRRRTELSIQAGPRAPGQFARSLTQPYDNRYAAGAIYVLLCCEKWGTTHVERQLGFEGFMARKRYSLSTSRQCDCQLG
jgi:hypothetical protein